MKRCELCERAARIYCESDQASLCWECDAKVHGANFLVARHTRCLLCRGCQAPTPWMASGARLGPTVSVCERCCLQGKRRREDVADDNENGEEKDEAEEDEGDDRMEDDDEEEEAEGEGEAEAEEEEEEEEEEGDNQVVPLSLTPPPVASSSSSEESTSRIYDGFLKRIREKVDPASPDDDIPRSSTRPTYLALAPARAVAEDEATSVAGGPFKDRNKAALSGSVSSSQVAAAPAKSQAVKPNSTTTDSTAAIILDIRQRRDPHAVDFAPSNSTSSPI